MADAKPRRFSLPALLLAAAAAVALASAGIAIARHGGLDSGESPAAKDWRIVGWAYAENGNAAASADAYRKAAAAEPGNAENWSSLGEALQASSSTVVPEAATAFRKALELDPSDPRARYFLAVQKDLAGDTKGALADWAALLHDTPEGAPWQADLRRTIAQTSERSGITPPPSDALSQAPATGAIPGPSPEQLAAASALPPSEQQKMASEMVDRLAARLARQPQDADGWIRLMRSKAVLNDTAGARAAFDSGMAAFKKDPATRQRMKSAATQLGIDRG